MKYNAVLRGLGGNVDWMKKKMEDLCQGNHYVTTLHVINSAIVKLGRLAKPRTVYRGVNGGVLPRQFWKRVGNGGVEFAFMSTTSDRDVAMGYARGRSEAATVMEIQMGMIDRGADLQWCSQCALPPPHPACPACCHVVLAVRASITPSAPPSTQTHTRRRSRSRPSRGSRCSRRASRGRCSW